MHFNNIILVFEQTELLHKKLELLVMNSENYIHVVIILRHAYTTSAAADDSM